MGQIVYNTAQRRARVKTYARVYRAQCTYYNAGVLFWTAGGMSGENTIIAGDRCENSKTSSNGIQKEKKMKKYKTPQLCTTRTRIIILLYIRVGRPPCRGALLRKGPLAQRVSSLN